MISIVVHILLLIFNNMSEYNSERSSSDNASIKALPPRSDHGSERDSVYTETSTEGQPPRSVACSTQGPPGVSREENRNRLLADTVDKYQPLQDLIDNHVATSTAAPPLPAEVGPCLREFVGDFLTDLSRLQDVNGNVDAVLNALSWPSN